MSISSTSRKAGPFAGNGIQTMYPFAFKVFQAADVVATSATSGVETVLTQGADYTVALNADQDAAPGGTVTLATPLANGSVLAITSDVSMLQPVTVTNGGGFFPTVFNAVFDRLTIFAQQLAEKLTRTMTIPVTATGVSNLQVPVRASAVLQWSPDGTQLLALPLPDLSLALALPNMAGKAGMALTTDGNTASWGSFVAGSRQILAGGLVQGGGNLTADRTFTVTAATAADVRAATSSNTAVTPNSQSGAAAFQNLTDAATVSWAIGSGYNASLLTTAAVGSTRAIGAPTGLYDGCPVTLKIVQDATGGRLVTWNAIWDFGANGVPVLSTTAGKIDYVFAVYDSAAGKLVANFRKAS